MQNSTAFRGNIADVDLRLLRVFIAVVDAEGVTPAQIVLNKSKSAISMDLSSLEERLGMVLAKRGRSGFALTEQGEMVYTATLELFSELERYRNYINLAASQLTGEISLMVDDNILFEVEEPLVAALRAFTNAHPNISLKFRSSSPDRIVRAVLSSSAHIGITALFKPMSAFDMQPLFKEHMKLYCGSDHPLFHVPDAEITYEDLQSHKFVDVNVRHDPQFRAFFSNLYVQAEAPTISTRTALILSGNYLGFLPSGFARQWEEQGKIRALTLPNALAINTIYLIRHKDPSASLVTGAASKILLEEFRKFGLLEQ